jgi:hypothetical protein
MRTMICGLLACVAADADVNIVRNGDFEDVSAVWLLIAVGQSATDVWVDNVRFYEGEYDPGPELDRGQAVDARGGLKGEL